MLASHVVSLEQEQFSCVSISIFFCLGIYSLSNLRIGEKLGCASSQVEHIICSFINWASSVVLLLCVEGHSISRINFLWLDVKFCYLALGSEADDKYIKKKDFLEYEIKWFFNTCAPRFQRRVLYVPTDFCSTVKTPWEHPLTWALLIILC